jgi:hypothetical protein
MEEPAILDALAAYARTAMEPVKSPATAAPVMTALDGFMIQFFFGIGFGFARLRKTRVNLSVVSSFFGQKSSRPMQKRKRFEGWAVFAALTVR